MQNIHEYFVRPIFHAMTCIKIDPLHSMRIGRTATKNAQYLYFSSNMLAGVFFIGNSQEIPMQRTK